MSWSNEPPSGWLFGFSLSSDHVWLGFLPYCLLEDTVECGEYLLCEVH